MVIHHGGGGGSERKKRRFADRSVNLFVKSQKAAASGIRELLGSEELIFRLRLDSKISPLVHMKTNQAGLSQPHGKDVWKRWVRLEKAKIAHH